MRPAHLPQAPPVLTYCRGDGARCASLILWTAASSPMSEPVTRWMAANVAVAQDPAGNLKPAKDKSTERIDGIVALIMAIGRALVAQEEPQPEYSMFFV
jgi:Phage Terminase